ncbi:helix-turn-helix domain-containing protein [uncultured Roseibium sp.]|uniref:winged helix-turn-helix transcriptional regulator n=1 Tax=uncultured Roseibium sp. TaxID=1936171 RepID=UPI0026345441|nr:helix-turn-helix domain-containing protein [uncultured Roseibium sp.]
MNSAKNIAPDVLDRMCPSRIVLNHVTSRWGVLVLIALQQKTLRFSELRRIIGDVSEKMLSQTLKTLENDGFVHREALNVVPPHVEYRLTPHGQGVAVHVKALAAWVEDNIMDLPRSGNS